MYQEIELQLSYLSPCYVTGVRHCIQVPKENEIQVCLTAYAIGNMLDIDDPVILPNIFELDSSGLELLSISPFGMDVIPMAVSPTTTTPASVMAGPSSAIAGMAKVYTSSFIEQVLRKNIRNIRKLNKENSSMGSNVGGSAGEIDYFPPNSPIGMPLETLDSRISESSRGGGSRESRTDSIDPIRLSAHYIDTRPSVHITLSPNHTLPNGEVIERFLGHVSLHFVKENGLLFGSGSGLNGMGGFTHCVISEFYAILRYVNKLISI
jgi:hypothetical protein